MWYVFYEVRSMPITTFATPNCEVRLVTRFQPIEKVSGAEIYHRLCTAYGEANIVHYAAHNGR